ncbi:MAG: hypothetical protein GX835_13325 [Desulfobulbaceae bacterium]|nr:hypothetical protein [Desulfobulbaceae bacterium]
MAEQKAFDKTRAARRRLALLALSGDQPAPATPCPEPTELAALVEGRLEPAREETCLAHLAGCDRCCALWLQLDRHRQEQAATGRRGRLLRLVGRPRALTVAGSLLAAAASLALVLTLTLQADRTTLTRLPEKTAEVQSRATPGTDSAVPAESGENPVAAGSTQPRSRAAKREDAVVHNKIAPAEPASPAAEAQPAATGGQDLERSGQKAASLPGTAADEQAPPPSGQFQLGRRAKAPLTVSGWQDRIRAGCTGQPDAAFFAGIRDQGRTLLAAPAGLNAPERHRIERILALLAQPQPADDHCRAMLDLLGPAAPEKAP